eukprot:TRINITY_DN13980_c0_g1_i1.p1 TRINITY_DN13980_c0_g1~~TRINITY_DN13980_c0_g1_i1.p1  ORF type:complete len:133 (-),score=30.66 TRINITY_DN13980_c0_g1_i1:29-427(-)
MSFDGDIQCKIQQPAVVGPSNPLPKLAGLPALQAASSSMMKQSSMIPMSMIPGPLDGLKISHALGAMKASPTDVLVAVAGGRPTLSKCPRLEISDAAAAAMLASVSTPTLQKKMTYNGKEVGPTTVLDDLGP